MDTGLFSNDGKVESKLEVVVMEDEIEEYYLSGGGENNDEETAFQLHDNNETSSQCNGVYGNHFEEVDPLQDPLQLDETDIHQIRQQKNKSAVTSSCVPKMQLRSTPVAPQIHPFALKIQRLNPDIQKLSPHGKKNGVVTMLNSTSESPTPSSSSALPFTIAEAESQVRTFIDNCVSSRKDPLCRHQFYYTCHSVLNEALLLNLITSENVDSYWKKFDEWAASSTSYRVGDHYMLQYRHRANDPDEDPPKPKKLTRQKKRHSKVCSTSPGRLLKIMMRNLEQSVKLYVLNSRYLPLRDDLYSRVKFYQTWHKYYNAGSELFLDFYWNALVNRSIEYYDHCEAAASVALKLSTKKVVLPPSPKKMKVDGMPHPPPLPKNLDMDRIVKLAINNCIVSGKDPRLSHKFYWTVHRTLETVQSLHLSLNEIDSLWKKYDDWAELAYSKGTTFHMPKVLQLYNDVSELPPPAKKITPKRPEELKIAYPAGLKLLLETRVKGFIIALNITKNYLRDSLKQRRLFLETYVYFVEPGWRDELIDLYWYKLATDTVHSYKSAIQNTSTLPTPPPPPPPVTASTNLANVPKKFDMDRLIQLCINSCVESGKDPKSTHKFYWTIHRSLETVASLNLSKKDIDLLWKKYDEWAEEAFTTRRLFKLNFTYHYEYYADVSELPPRPVKLFNPPKPGCISRPNGLSKWLEKVVREYIIEKKSNINRIRNDLYTRRKFLQSYVDFVPLNYETDFVIDGYWRRLLRETIDDYKLYLKLSDKINEEEEPEIIEIVEPQSTLTNSVSSIIPTSSKNDGPKSFSMEYLVNKVIKSCVQSNVDPRLSHKFYWTIHRCIQESRRRNSSSRMTNIQLDAIWGQYDAIASKTFLNGNSTDFKYCVLEEDMMKNYNYFHDVNELPPPLLKDEKPCLPSVTQLFPNCPKSSALKKYLEQKFRQIVTKSPLVNYQNNYILNSMSTRREFFLSYVDYVKDMNVEAAEKLVSVYWKRLMTETRESLKKSGGASCSSSTAVGIGPSFGSSISSMPSTSSHSLKSSSVFVLASKEKEVPCIDID